MEQRDKEWYALRCGMITASKYPLLVKLDGTMKDGETAYSYIMQLLAERLGYDDGEPDGAMTTRAMEHGVMYEPVAIESYERAVFNKVDRIPFVKHPTLNTGGSPDGLVGDDGIVEVKCPYQVVNHIRTMVRNEVPNDYKAQIQGYLWLTDREYCDYISYNPYINGPYQMHVIRVYRDQKYIDALAVSVSNWCRVLDDMESELMGV